MRRLDQDELEDRLLACSAHSNSLEPNPRVARNRLLTVKNGGTLRQAALPRKREKAFTGGAQNSPPPPLAGEVAR